MTRIALIVLDTLRKDTFDKYFDWLPGKRFENAWSVSHWTAAVHASLFAGYYPSELGVHKKSEALDIEHPVLAEALSEEGFITNAFSANPYVSKSFGFDRGFETFDGTWKMKIHDEELFDWMNFISETRSDGPSRYFRALKGCFAGECKTIPSLKMGLNIKADSLGMSGFIGDPDDGAAQVYRRIQNEPFRDDSIFYFVNLMEAHGPYNPPEKYQSVGVRDSPGIKQTIDGDKINPVPIRQAYEDSVQHLSDMYHKIFNELSDSFDYIITLSDHGEMFGEHGVWGHSYGIYPELTHIPLTIYDGSDTKTTCHKPVSILDVHKTIADLAEVDLPSQGSNILDDTEGHPCLTEYHGMNTRMITKLRNNGISENIIRKHDRPLQGIALPPEYYGYETREGFTQSGSAEISNPEEKFEETRNDLNIKEIPPDENEISDSLAQHLEDLGYA